MATKDKEILKYVQNRLWKECFPDGYEAWAITDSMTDFIEEVTDEELANMPTINLDDFVSEMN